MGGFYARQHNKGQRVLGNEFQPGLMVHLSHTHFGCVWKILTLEYRGSELWLKLVAP